MSEVSKIFCSITPYSNIIPHLPDTDKAELCLKRGDYSNTCTRHVIQSRLWLRPAFDCITRHHKAQRLKNHASNCNTWPCVCTVDDRYFAKKHILQIIKTNDFDGDVNCFDHDRNTNGKLAECSLRTTPCDFLDFFLFLSNLGGLNPELSLYIRGHRSIPVPIFF